MRETFAGSLWSALAPPVPTLSVLSGQVRADVAVVGSGILGLSLALHLAQSGADVVLIDKNEPGFGASGRNTGFVVPSLPGGVSPSDLVPILGAEAAERLARFVAGSGAMLFDLVQRLGIECAAEQNGWLQPAHTARKAALIETRVRQWRALGQPVELLDFDATRTATGTDRYTSALLDPTGGQINPLAYARGLAEAAVAAGARLFRDSAAASLQRCVQGWRIGLAAGELLADQVFCTTNALVGDLLPDVRRSLVIVRAYQVATQPLDYDVRQRVLPRRQPVADLHRHVFAYRWSPDHRLITGGAAMLHDRGAVERMAEQFLLRLRRYVPGLPALQPAFAWSGVVSATDQRIPQLLAVGPGLYAPIGCNGRGVAITTAFGACLAEYARTGNLAKLPVVQQPPRPKRLSGLLNYGPSAWLGWSRLRDALDDRRAGR